MLQRCVLTVILVAGATGAVYGQAELLPGTWEYIQVEGAGDDAIEYVDHYTFHPDGIYERHLDAKFARNTFTAQYEDAGYDVSDYKAEFMPDGYIQSFTATGTWTVDGDALNAQVDEAVMVLVCGMTQMELWTGWCAYLADNHLPEGWERDDYYNAVIATVETIEEITINVQPLTGTFAITGNTLTLDQGEDGEIEMLRLGDPPTAVAATTWGRVKQRLR